MQLMLRDRDLAQLVSDLRGKKVMIWTCNTCARLCDVGGSSNAQRLATALRSEGIEVTSVASAKASCIATSVRDNGGKQSEACDIVLVLACDTARIVAGEVFARPCLNPVVTVGPGYISESGTPVSSEGMGRVLETVSAEEGLPAGPFV